MPKIAEIISFKDFRDEEYFIPKQEFEKAGFKVTTISTKKGKALGKLGGETESTLLIEDVNIEDFDALVFVGGPGAHKNIDDERFHKLAKAGLEKGKIVAAICIAPAILAKAGLLKNRKATVWASNMDKSAVRILEREGADYAKKAVVRDKNIITASGPGAAKDFALEVINAL